MWFEIYAKEKMKHRDGSHDVSHAYRVAKNVERLMSKEDPDRQCAIVCAWLHDICDKKYTNTETAVQMIKRACRREKIEFFETLEHVVQNISYTQLRKKGPPTFANDKTYKIWNIVAQADMIDALGIIGIIRTLMYQGSIQNHLNGAIRYLEEHLLDCIQFINVSEEMQAEGKERHVNMSEWLKLVDVNDNIKILSEMFVFLGEQRESFSRAVEHLQSHPSKEANFFNKKLVKELCFSC